MKDELALVIQQLADKLGVTAEYLWSVLLKQAPITAALDAVWALLLACAATASLKASNSLVRRDGYEDPEYVVKKAIFLTCFGFSSFISITLLDCAITAALNPEYWALKQIIK